MEIYFNSNKQKELRKQYITEITYNGGDANASWYILKNSKAYNFSVEIGHLGLDSTEGANNIVYPFIFDSIIFKKQNGFSVYGVDSYAYPCFDDPFDYKLTEVWTLNLTKRHGYEKVAITEDNHKIIKQNGWWCCEEDIEEIADALTCAAYR